MLLLGFLAACSQPGVSEDEFGHPRELLANCTRLELRDDQAGNTYVYDAHGYYAFGPGPDGDWFDQVTTLDALGRPVLVAIDGFYESVVRLEREYVDDTWRLKEERYSDGAENVGTYVYTWRDGSYVREGSSSRYEAALGEGLREVSIAHEIWSPYTDAWGLDEHELVWEDDRLIRRTTLSRWGGSSGQDGHLHRKHAFRYNDSSRLVAEDVSDEEGALFTRTWEWSCP